MLAINVFRIVIAYGHNLFCVVIAFACLVYFELDAEITRTRTVKDRVGFVVIILNPTVAFKAAVAIVTIRVIVISVPIVGIVRVNNPAASDAGIVVVIIAIVAERRLRAAGVIVQQNGFAAVGAGGCVFVHTVVTEPVFLLDEMEF